MSLQINKAQEMKKATHQHNMLQTAKGGGFLAAGQFFAFGSRFAIAFLVARQLGATEYGMYTLSISAATIIASIATLGLGSTMVRYVAIETNNNDEEAVWGTIQIGAVFSFLSSILLSIGLYFLAEPIAVYIFNDPALASFLQLFSLFIPFATLSTILVEVMRGFKRMDYSALAEYFVLFIARTILIFTLSLSGLNTYKAILAYGISDVVVSVTLIYFINKTFKIRRPVRRAKRNYREIFTFAIPFWISGLLTKFRKNMQTLLLGSLNTITSVGVFAIANKVNLVGHVVYASVIASVKPVLAQLQNQKDFEGMSHLYKATTRWSFTANLPIFLIMALFPAQLLGIFGRSFTDGAAALVVLAFGELINAGTGICGSIIDMTGHTKLKLFNAILWITLVLGGNLLLIPRWGVMGTAVASFFSVSMVNVLRVIQVWLLYRIHPYNRTYLKPIAAGLVATTAVLLLGLVVPAQGLKATAIHIAVLLLLFGGVWLGLGLPPEERIIINRLYRRFIRMLKPFEQRLPERWRPGKFPAGSPLGATDEPGRKQSLS